MQGVFTRSSTSRARRYPRRGECPEILQKVFPEDILPRSKNACPMAFLRGRQCRGRGDIRAGANAPKYCKAIFYEDIITYPPKFSKFFLRAGTDFYFKERFGRKNSGNMAPHIARLCFFVSVFLTLMDECGILNRKIFGEGAMKRTFNIVGNAAMWLFLIFAVTHCTSQEKCPCNQGIVSL